MQVVFHLGAPCTDDDLLLQTLIRNRDVLWGEGVAVPPPGRYRAIVRDTARTLKGRPPGPRCRTRCSMRSSTTRPRSTG
jgi:hypothetical protein